MPKFYRNRFTIGTIPQLDAVSVITASQSAFLNNTNANTNVNNGDLAICNGYNGSYYYTNIVRFDASSLIGKTYSSAKLRIYSKSCFAPAVGCTVSFYKCTRSDWVYNQATWNQYKTSSNWSTGGGDFVTTAPSGATYVVPNTTVNQLIELDLKAIIDDAIANNGGVINIRIAITQSSGGNDFSFYGVNDANVSFRPSLIISKN